MGFLCLVLQGLLVLFLNRKNIKITFIILLILSLGFLRAHENFWERISTITAQSMETEDVDDDSKKRANKWRQAIRLTQMHPYTGAGISRFRYAVYSYELGEYLHIVHNAYLEIACETGLICISLYFLFLMKIGFGLYGARNTFISYERNDSVYITNYLIISFASLCFCLIFLSEQYNSIFYIICALSASLIRHSKLPQNASKEIK